MRKEGGMVWMVREWWGRCFFHVRSHSPASSEPRRITLERDTLDVIVAEKYQNHDKAFISIVFIVQIERYSVRDKDGSEPFHR